MFVLEIKNYIPITKRKNKIQRQQQQQQQQQNKQKGKHNKTSTAMKTTRPPKRTLIFSVLIFTFSLNVANKAFRHICSEICSW